MSEQKKILIVDDSKENRLLLTMLLEDDYSIIEADSGEKCLSLIEEAIPDLLLLDVSMPGMSGYQVCEKLRKKKNTQDLPIIFVSGMDNPEERLAGFEAGGDEYVIKPVDGQDLLNKVQSHLQKHQERHLLHENANNAMKVAMEAMTVSSELGQIIGFVKDGQKFTSRTEVGEAMLLIAREFQLSASIMIISETHEFFGCEKDSTEAKFLEKVVNSRERMMMLGIRFVIHDQYIVMLIKELPQDDDNRTGRLKDHLAVLMDIANGHLINMAVRSAQKKQRREFLTEIISIVEKQIKLTSEQINQYSHNSESVMRKMLTDLEEMLFSLGLEEDQEKKLMSLADQTSDELHELNVANKNLDEELGLVLDSLYNFLAMESKSS